MNNTSGRFRKLPEYENSQITNKIKEKIHSKRDRTILYLKLVDDLSFMIQSGQVGGPMMKMIAPMLSRLTGRR